MRMKRCLWKKRTPTQMQNRIEPVTSHISKAQGIWGMLSRKRSGSGGNFSMSGTLRGKSKKGIFIMSDMCYAKAISEQGTALLPYRSWTMTIASAVTQVTTKT
jgi:hypothetical protein